MQTTAPGPCQVVPAATERACTNPGRNWGQGQPILCKAHHKQYGTLTAAYHAHQSAAERMYPQAMAFLAGPGQLRAFQGTREVEDAIRVSDRAFAELEKEIQGREAHHTRFFLQMDDGHRLRIEFLRGQQQSVQAVVGMLVSRKRELVEEERARALALRNQAGVLAPHEAAVACWTLFMINLRSKFGNA